MKIEINKKKAKLRPNKLFIITKLFLIIILILGLYYFNIPFSNEVSLLAVHENEKNEIKSGSIVGLKLTIKPGSGESYVKLNNLKETDTQISIINSQKIACNLFKLNCNEYDFYYEFSDDSALVLKGPSGSTAIAILVAKTIKKEKIDKNTVITGSLNSGGLIGVVGGIDQKIKIAQENDFKKVLIPIFSNYNITNTTIEIVPVIDIIEAYNNYNGKKYSLKSIKTNSTNYTILMKELAQNLCDRTQIINSKINNSNIIPNKSIEIFYNRAINSYNNSIKAHNNSNYYSQGSFCFNSNINYRTVLEIQKNLSLENRTIELNKLYINISNKIIELNSEKYLKKIQTINDFYVYLLLTDRLEESKKLIENAKDIKVIPQINQSNSTINLTFKKLNTENILRQKNSLYSYALERFQTVIVWEKFITHQDTKIKFSKEDINIACEKINREIAIKEELLSKYEFNYFNDLISEQKKLNSPFENKYLCIYKGLELTGRINTILNSIGVNESELNEYTSKVNEITKTRINHNSNGNFQLIPTIYQEYSNELLIQNDSQSSLLYSNFALSYADLNLYIDTQINKQTYINLIAKQLFENILFIGALIFIIGFLN